MIQRRKSVIQRQRNGISELNRILGSPRCFASKFITTVGSVARSELAGDFAVSTPRRIPYRPDVDGLRGTAILCVVLYHLRIPGFGGGFVGVDIFFAISGFLIFSILMAEYENRLRVDWLAFYARRIRRLVPEATIMIITILILGWFVLVPLGQQQTLAESAMAGSMWGANIFFWKFGNGGYFHPSVERQPFLHLWSLGVEEQFYLFAPLVFLLVTHLLGRSRSHWRSLLALLLLLVAASSLAVAAWASHKDIFAAAAYYLLPTRAYEFAVGALAALMVAPASTLVGYSRRIYRLISLAGLIGVVVSVILAKRGQNFPSARALPCVLSTAVFLWSTSKSGQCSNVLKWNPIVFVGKCSYGWYLWHYPMLVLWREYWLFDTTMMGDVAVVLFALVPSAIGYRYVSSLREAGNARQSPDISRKTIRYGIVAAGTGIAMSSAVYAGANVMAVHDPAIVDLKGRLSDQYKFPDGCEGTSPETAAPSNCIFGDRHGAVTLVLWGDSHALHWVPALDPLFKSLGVMGVGQIRPGCPPSLPGSGLLPDELFARCKGFGANVLSDIFRRRRGGPVAVLLAGRWAAYGNHVWQSRIDEANFPPGWQRGPAALDQSLDLVVGQLTAAEVPTGLFLQVPELRMPGPDCLHKWPVVKCAISRTDSDGYLSESRAVAVGVAKAYGAQLFDPEPIMCNEAKCALYQGDTLLYVDHNHLSTRGALALSKYLAPFVMTMREEAVKGAQSAPLRNVN